MEQTISDVVKVKCFNCKDKGEVVVSTHCTANRQKVMPCPICHADELMLSSNEADNETKVSERD